MTGNVHVEAKMFRSFTRRSLCPPVSFAYVNGVIAVLSQKFDKGCAGKGMLNGVAIVSYASLKVVGLHDSVHVPVGCGNDIIVQIGRLVAAQCPVGHTMAGGIGSRHERTAAWRTDGRSISLREKHAFGGQSLHVRCLIGVVERCSLVPKGNGCVLPTHVVDHEKDDVWPQSITTTLLKGGNCRHGTERSCSHETGNG